MIKAEQERKAEEEKERISEGNSPQKSEGKKKRISGQNSGQKPKRKKKKSGRGKGRKAGSQRDVEEATGCFPGRSTATRAPRRACRVIPVHAAAALEAIPLLEAGDKLEELSEPDRPKAASLLDQDGIPPRQVAGILANLAEMPAVHRAKIFELAGSDSDHDRKIALMEAARLPPPPDPAFPLTSAAARDLRKAVKLCVTPGFREELEKAAECVADINSRFTEFQRRKAREWRPAGSDSEQEE